MCVWVCGGGRGGRGGRPALVFSLQTFRFLRDTPPLRRTVVYRPALAALTRSRSRGWGGNCGGVLPTCNSCLAAATPLAGGVVTLALKLWPRARVMLQPDSLRRQTNVESSKSHPSPQHPPPLPITDRLSRPSEVPVHQVRAPLLPRFPSPPPISHPFLTSASQVILHAPLYLGWLTPTPNPRPWVTKRGGSEVVAR